MLHRILAMCDAELLVQIADVRLDGRCRDGQLSGDLLVAVARINQSQNLPFALGQRAGADKFRHFRVSKQTLNEPFIEVGKFMAVVLVNLTQNALGAVLIELR